MIMEVQTAPYSIPLFIATGIVLLLAVVTWRRKGIPGSLALCVLLTALGVWSLTSAIQILVATIPAKVFWLKLAHLGIASAPILFPVFALQYSQIEISNSRWFLAAISILPVINFSMALTNDWHHWVWSGFTLNPSTGLLTYNDGPWFWVIVAYSYLAMIAGTGVLIWSIFHSHGMNRSQIIMVLLAAVIPWVGNITYLLGYTPVPDLDITPFTFSITGIFLILAIYRFQLFVLVPIARGLVVDTMRDAVLVIDNHNRIVDLNPAACSVLAKTVQEVIGQPVDELLTPWPFLATLFSDQNPFPIESKMIQDHANRWYDLRISPLKNQRDRVTGWLIFLHDITAKAQAEAEASRLASVIEQASETIVITDTEGNIQYANPFFEKITGYTIEEALGENPRILKSGYQDEAFYKKMWDTILSGKTWEGTFVNKRKDGSIYHEAATIFPVTDVEGNITSYAAVKRDITAQVETEQELRDFARYQKLLNDITTAAVEQTDLEMMLQILADRIGELLNADGCYMTLWDEATRQVTPGAAYGPLREKYKNIVVNEDEPTLTEEALRREEPLVIPDVFDTPHISPRLAAMFPSRSQLVLPLIANQQKLGAALIAYNDPHDFTPEEVEYGTQAAQQIALAILKTKLLNSAQRRATEADTLRQAGAAIATTLNQEEAINRILEELNRVVPYDSASVQLMDGDELEIVGQRGFIEPSKVLGMRFPATEETPNAHVYHNRETLILEDAPATFAAFREPPHDHIHGWMGVPLIVHDKVIGMIALDSTQPGRFAPQHARLAKAFADQVAIALENARLFEETQRLARIDPLTGLYNRRHFMELAIKEFKRSLRYMSPLSIIMLDIDNFKKVNDSLGHMAGDQVLQTIANLCLNNLRDVDIIGRYGGEEFVILLPQTPAQHIVPTSLSTHTPAETVADRLRKTIEETSIETEWGTASVTISLGVAECTSECKTIDNLINHADQALLLAKHGGKNQVVIWPPV
jgi:diguanylate cyclase (GGDEF)-like protein/PAS domain S-box-containing protein